MNITFTIMAHGFDKAAQIEKALKEIGAPYEANIAKPVGGANSRKTRTVVDKALLAIVVTAIDKYPDRTDAEIARETNVSHATVGRIRNGHHCLQIKASKAKLESVKAGAQSGHK